MRLRISKVLFGTTALAGLMFVGAAQAADMPLKAPRAVVAPYSWTGFYVGGHVGYGWGDKDFSLPDIAGEKFGYCDTKHMNCFDFSDLGNPALTHKLSGFLGGVQAGFNVQSGAWVLGIEGQFSWTGMDEQSKALLGEYIYCYSHYDIGLNAKTEVNWVATIAGRIGYTFDRFMIYAKGGVAFADQDYNWVVTKGDHDFTSAKFGETRTGWMVGVGTEWVLTGSWTAKLEYNFMDFGDKTLNVVADVYGRPKEFKINIDEQMHVVKFGINYRFGAPVAVVAKY
jgi:outer membrane immunogenic protein